MSILGIIIIIGLAIYLYRRLTYGTGSWNINSPDIDKDRYSIDQEYNVGRHKRKKEIDRILDKISKRGINSLTKEEKDKLDRYSKKD